MEGDKVVREISSVFLISDTHVGKKTRTFDINVFEERIKSMFDKMLDFKSVINRSYRMPDIHLMFLGDILDGEEIYAGQGYDVELIVDEAMDRALDIFTAQITRLMDRFEKVYIYGVAGNHGRANRRGRTNWDIIFYKRLKDRFSMIEDVEINIGDWKYIADIRGWKYLLIHGDQIYMYQNIPTYGIIQKAMRWYTGGLDEQFDVVCLGHFHTFFRFDWNNISIFCNGTLLTGDDYTEKLGLRPQTKFWYLGVSRNNKIEFAKEVEV